MKSTRGLFICVIFLVVVAFILGRSQRQRSTQQRYAIASTYLRQGLFDNTIFGTNTKTLQYSLIAVQFEAGENAKSNISGFLKTLTNANTTNIIELPPIRLLEDILNRLAIGTRFSGRVQINKEPKIGHLNILFLSKDPRRLSPTFKNNCAFVGDDLIVCDAEYLKSELERFEHCDKYYDTLLHNQDGTTIDPSTNAEKKTFVVNWQKRDFMVWILGHEMGHAIHHATLLEPTRPAFHFDATYDRIEMEADSFVASFVNNNPGLRSSFRLALGEYIHQEFRRACIKRGLTSDEGEEISLRDFPLYNKLTVHYSEFRMPLLVRGARIEQTLLRLSPGEDIPEYHQIIESNIELVKDSGTNFDIRFSLLVVPALFLLVVTLRQTR